MTLRIGDIPDNPQQLGPWLEQQLVGLELRELVDELRAFADPQTESATLEGVLDEHLPEAIRHGLGSLRAEQLRMLLQHPELLFELQQRVGLEGGRHWLSVPRSAEHQAAVSRGWERLSAALSQGEPVRESTAVEVTARPNRWSFTLGLVGTLAAVLLIAVTLNYWPRSSEPTWGFGRSDLLTANLPPQAYLESLATAAGDWRLQRLETAAALSQRMQEFRQGCQRLITAEHPQLSPADRDWLRDRCRAWAGEIDRHLADLQQGRKSVAEVRVQADKTIDDLIRALRKRSAQVA